MMSLWSLSADGEVSRSSGQVHPEEAEEEETEVETDTEVWSWGLSGL